MARVATSESTRNELTDMFAGKTVADRSCLVWQPAPLIVEEAPESEAAVSARVNPTGGERLRVLLERLGLVIKMRMGQMVCYELNRDNPIARQLVKLLKDSNK